MQERAVLARRGFESLEDLCPELSELLKSRRAPGRTGKTFDGLGALSTVNNLVTLGKLMEALQPRRTLEVGVSHGGSTLLFTACHRRLGRPAHGQHVALDPYQGTVWDDSGLMAVERAGLEGYLDFRPEKSCIALPGLLGEKAQFDLVYVDGSHLFEDVFVDAYFVVRLLSPGGIVAFDDSSNPHIRKVRRFLDSTLASGLKRVDVSAYRQERGGLRYWLAAQLGRVQMTAYERIGEVERTWNAPFRSF